MNLGKHYLALAVKNIEASKSFYEKLGFQADERWGGIPDKWLLMHNGSTTIGLFQDMFPKNVLTFTPDNARLLHRAIADQGIEIALEANIDKEEGPCHFSIIDPDGNPILIDQHN